MLISTIQWTRLLLNESNKLRILPRLKGWTAQPFIFKQSKLSGVGGHFRLSSSFFYTHRVIISLGYFPLSTGLLGSFLVFSFQVTSSFALSYSWFPRINLNNIFLHHISSVCKTKIKSYANLRSINKSLSVWTNLVF